MTQPTTSLQTNRQPERHILPSEKNPKGLTKPVMGTDSSAHLTSVRELRKRMQQLKKRKKSCFWILKKKT